MKARKTLALVALVAAAAVAVLAVVPASATTGKWWHGASELKTETTLSLSGGEVFEAAGGGMSCKATGTLTTSGGSTATVTAFTVGTTECTGFGKFAGCKLSSAKALSTPWSVAVETTALKVSGGSIERKFTSCGTITELVSTVTTQTWTPVTPSSIKEFEYIGTGTAKTNKESGLEYTAFGSFTVGGAANGTYSIK